jgi:hypothetical protein
MKHTAVPAEDEQIVFCVDDIAREGKEFCEMINEHFLFTVGARASQIEKALDVCTRVLGDDGFTGKQTAGVALSFEDSRRRFVLI